MKRIKIHRSCTPLRAGLLALLGRLRLDLRDLDARDLREHGVRVQAGHVRAEEPEKARRADQSTPECTKEVRTKNTREYTGPAKLVDPKLDSQSVKAAVNLPARCYLELEYLQLRDRALRDLGLRGVRVLHPPR